MKVLLAITALQVYAGIPSFHPSLWDGPALDDQPCWSPDGLMVAYASRESGILDIWVIAVPVRGVK